MAIPRRQNTSDLTDPLASSQELHEASRGAQEPRAPPASTPSPNAAATRRRSSSPTALHRPTARIRALVSIYRPPIPSALVSVAVARTKTTRAPHSGEARRLHLRARRPDPCRVSLSAPVACACHGHAPEPSHGPNRLRGRQFGLPRRSAAAEHAVGDVPPPPSPA